MSTANPKSSDEILHELFDSLNLPVSPASLEKISKNSNKASRSSSDNESDSNLSLSSSSSTDQEIYKLLEDTTELELPKKSDSLDLKFLESPKTHKKDKKKRKKHKKGESKSKNKKKKKFHKSKGNDSDSEYRKESKTSKKSESTFAEAKKSTHNSDDDLNYRDKKSKSSRSRSRSRKRVYSRSRSKSRCRGSGSKRSSAKSGHYRSRSRSRSKSVSHRNGSHKSHRRRSTSHSHSPSPRRHHKPKSKSKSRSPLRKESVDPLDIWRTAKLASLKKISSVSMSSDTKDDTRDGEEGKNDPVKMDVLIEKIPLPIPAGEPDSNINPSVIPLPSVNNEEQTVGDLSLDLKTIPIPSNEDTVSSVIETNNSDTQLSYPKTADSSKNKEEGKGKTIVIKNLKGSLVLQQAEEAQKKNKVEEEVTVLGEMKASSSATEVTVENPHAKDDNLPPNTRDASEEEGTETSALPCTDRKSVEKAVVEEGEIESEDELEIALRQGKEKSKKEKKDKKSKNSSKEHKKKSENKKSKHKSRSRSRSRRRSTSRSKRSRSRSRTRRKSRSKRTRSSSRSRKRSRSKSKSRRSRSKSRSRRKSRSKSVSRRRTSRSRSTSKGTSSSRIRSWKRSRSRSDSLTRSRTSRRSKRSSSRDGKGSPDCVDSLRDKATRKRLLEVARRNAVYLMRNNCLPPSIEKESVKATGKSVEELTSFCQQLVAKDYSDTELSDPSLSPDEQDGQFDKPFGTGRHPFAIKDSKPILMNIRNAPMLPTKTNAERLADTSKLREQFPVSSGSQHRNVAEIGWVPVEKNVTKTTDEPTVFPQSKLSEVDISQLVSTRLNAMRRLQDNPRDKDAMKALNSAQKEMQDWALSKQKPGQFTGSTGARILSQEELSSGYQAWARKEQFREANPVSSHFGMKMLQKMGWNPGEGLGKNKEGQIEPLLLDVKMDKKGLTAQQEMTPRRTPIPLAKSLAGKHPVSALVEICSKRKWGPPEFEIVFDCGPDHKKNFLMKVHVNNQTYKPAIAASTKKIAKANAAAACLQALGLIPKDVPKPQGTLQTSSQAPQQGPTAATSPPHGNLQNIPQPGESSQTLSPVSSIPQPPTLQPQNAVQSIPTPQAAPLPTSANLPPLPQGKPCPPPVPPSGNEPVASQGGMHPSNAVPNPSSNPSLVSQPVTYPVPVGGMYGAPNLYAPSTQFDQTQYFGASGIPYQGSSMQ